MCRFKSGIILKNKVVVAPGENDSHSDLLESLGINDDYFGATNVFVRAELVPVNGEWWIDPAEEPDKWRFIVDQDMRPEWFDESEHEKIFREAVCDWWKEHVLVDQKLEELSSGYYRLKRCEVKRLLNDVKVLLGSSQVGVMLDSSQVVKMLDSSRVGEMRGISRVGEMRGISRVGVMLDSSQVGEMRDSSQVGEMWGSSQVGVMLDSSQVVKMLDSSRVGEMRGISRVGEMRGISRVGVMLDSSQVGEMLGSSQVVKMRGISQVGEMRDSSQVGEMWDSSQVVKMWGRSTARDFKNWPNVKIWVSPEGTFEMVAHQNKSEE